MDELLHLHCKRCSEVLQETEGGGRPREYCEACEMYRKIDRYIDWKTRHETYKK